MHRRFLGLAVEAGLGVGEAVAGEHHLLLHQQGRTAALGVQFVAVGHLAPQCGIQLARGVVHHADFQAGGAAQDVLGLGRVLHAGQLHHDAVRALLLDHRFGHAEFVDPVVQGGDVLLDGEFLDALLGRQGQGTRQLEVGAVLGLGELQIRLGVGQDELGLLAGGVVLEADGDVLAFPVDAAVAHALVAQQAAQVGGDGVQLLGDGALHVHLQQEVHPAAQVQAQVHGQGVEIAQPLGRAGQQVQGDDVGRVGRVRVQGLFDGVLGLDLGVRVGEAGAHAVQVAEDALVGDGGCLEGLLDALLELGCVDLQGDLAAGHLHRRHLAVEIRQGVKETKDHRKHDDQVFPEWITIHMGRIQDSGARIQERVSVHWSPGVRPTC